MASGNAFNQPFIPAYMNGAYTICLNEILIVKSLGGTIQLCSTFYAAIHGKCY